MELEEEDIPKQSANFPDLFGTPPSQAKGKASGLNHAILNPEKDNILAEDPPLRSIPPPPKEAPPPPPPPSSTGQHAAKPSTLRETVQPGISRRSDFPLVREKVNLLIIDVQAYLSQSDGGFFQDSLSTMCSNIPTLIQAFRTRRDTQNQGCEVIFTYLQSLTRNGRDISLDYALSGPLLANIPTCTTPLEELFLDSIMPELDLGKGDILLPKTSCSVFASTNIDYVLRNLHGEQLVICGQLTDQCVESAVRDAADLGYFVTVVKDACAAMSPEAETKGFHGMSGFSRFLSTQQILEELSGDHTVSAVSNLHSEYRLGLGKGVGALCSGKSEKLSIKQQPVVSTTDKSFSSAQEAAYTSALLHSLHAAGVEFLRYFMVDVCNTIRCKAVPLSHLQKKSSLNYQVAVATVVMAGLPSYADSVVDETGLNASGVLILQPDLSTLRVLPYAPKSALLLGALHDPTQGGALSGLCTRGLLHRVARTAKEEFGIEFCVGAEIEFCLHDAVSGKPIDNSSFCNSTTLNQQEEFLSDLYRQLREQRIPVEAVHAESAPGQLEVVISYQEDPVDLADFCVLTQETIRAVSRAHLLKALFLPKIHPTQAGNGLHLHMSFNDLATGKNALSSTNGLSNRGQSFVEGMLVHLGGLLALTMPTTNSFRRMAPGCWTGSAAVWALEDKESAIRVCQSLHSEHWEHVEYKLNDSSSNLYLGLAGILTCGLDGIRRAAKLRPAKSDDATDGTTALPASVEECLECLEQDDLLLQMMGPILSKSYIALRRAEAHRASKMDLDQEVKECLDRA